MQQEESEIQDIVAFLSKHFEMSSGPVQCFVGVQIIRDPSSRKIYLSQAHYIQQVLLKFNMQDCHPKKIPMDPNSCLTSAEFQDPKKKNEMKMVPYREAVGSLMYIMVMTRPDIAYAVSQVAQFAQDPGPAHWEGVKRIMSYLAGTQHFGICFGFSNAVHQLSAYTDSDFAGDTDTRKSTSGFVFLLNCGPVAWSSKRQTCVTLSTTEAEYVAASETTKEVIFLRNLLDEIGVKQIHPTPLHCDNQGAIKLVYNPEFHNRTKHIDVKYHFIREKQSGGAINIVYLETEKQAADMFNKPLDASRFETLRAAIGVQEIPSSF